MSNVTEFRAHVAALAKRLRAKPMYPMWALQRDAAGALESLDAQAQRYEWLIAQVREMVGCRAVEVPSVSVEGHLSEIASALGKVREYA